MITERLTQAWIDDILCCDPTIFGEPYTEATPHGAYRNQFWIEDHRKRTFMARGVFGQLIHIDPDENMVVVKLSSWPEFISVERALDTYAAVRAIAIHLNGRPAS